MGLRMGLSMPLPMPLPGAAQRTDHLAAAVILERFPGAPRAATPAESSRAAAVQARKIGTVSVATDAQRKTHGRDRSGHSGRDIAADGGAKS
jgi:hypothetical protein